MLPTKKTERVVDFAQSNTLIYGAPKIGKSTFCANIPNALFLTTEEGLRHLKVYECKIKVWEDLRKLPNALKTEKHDYKTLLVDTADLLWKQCEDYIKRKQVPPVSDISEIPFGKGYNQVLDEFVAAITHLNQMGFGMIFISHVDDKEKKTKTESYMYTDCTLSKKAHKYLCGLCDHILYFYVNSEGKRMIRTKQTKHINAGTRAEKMPEILPLDYASFIKTYEESVK